MLPAPAEAVFGFLATLKPLPRVLRPAYPSAKNGAPENRDLSFPHATRATAPA